METIVLRLLVPMYFETVDPPVVRQHDMILHYKQVFHLELLGDVFDNV